MNIQIGNTVLDVKWSFASVESNTKKKRRIPTTTCLIKDNKKKVLTSKTIVLFHKDVDNKEQAKKISLVKALETVILSDKFVIDL